MDFAFSDEQAQFGALTRTILERTLTEERMRSIEASPDRFDDKLFVQLGEAGALGVALPSELGGGGYGLIELCHVLLEVGRTVAPVPAAAAAIGAGAVATFADGALARTWVPEAAQGRRIVVPAIAEPLHTDPAAPLTTARRRDGSWLLAGSKTTVPAGTFADAFLIPATTDEGVKVFLIERGEAGVSIEHQKVTDTSAEAALELDNVVVGAERIVGGRDAVDWIVRHLTVALCAVQLGICERAVELTAEYSKERVQFERPIATFQAVGQRLADAFIDVEAIRLTLWQAAWRLSEGLPCDAEIATAKFWASDAGHRVAHTAVHVHGGVGIDLDYPLHRYFTAAKRIEFALGGATQHLVKLGEHLATEPA